MRVLIADDEPIARQILREHVASIESLEIVGEASTGAEALDRIFALSPDLVLLDFEMPRMDGLSVVRSLRSSGGPLIIFVTAYERHAVEALNAGAVDYLLKPVRRERLEQAVEKARRYSKGAAAVAKDGPRKIVGMRASDLYLLDAQEVVAFRAEGELVHVIAVAGRYLSSDTLKELEGKLEKPRFRRIHRSTIIDTDHIRKISPLSSKRWMLTMSNGWEAIVSRRLAGAIRESSEW